MADCACKISYGGRKSVKAIVNRIDRCRLHANAGRLLAALIEAAGRYHLAAEHDPIAFEDCLFPVCHDSRAAISAAEGK